MARSGNSEYRVHKAAEELKAQGIEPTVRKVRSMIGGGTELIMQHLRTWRERQPQVLADEPNADPIQLAVSAVYDQILNQVREELLKLGAEQDLELTNAGERLEAASLSMADAQTQITDLQDRLNAETAHVVDLQTQLIESDKQLAVARTQINSLEKVRVQLEEREFEKRELISSLDGEKSKIRDLEQQNSRQREQMSERVADSRLLQVRIDRLTEESDLRQSSVQKLEAENERLQLQLSEMEIRLAEGSQNYQADRELWQQKNAQLQAEQALHVQTIAQHEASLLNKSAEIEQLTQRLANQAQQSERSQAAQLENLADTVAGLSQQLSVLGESRNHQVVDEDSADNAT
ncbi:hypothetical protein HBA55_28000 [Pseudomaricurvus alkylphenolicus]|uniref:DNA-binding protein n=1 Tax=Pseudomaricurvus alkylphenolicus TaxID=1306991 RepID=UPI00142104A3|nr:DNA-binding protein [Pseudomaricurvus alkylphenolicus]NIB43484.1 hypothetical protein [Pseudomaricurvus alkylphenolicus]